MICVGRYGGGMTTTQTPTPFDLDVTDVWCTECGAGPGEQCLANNGKPYKSRTYHEPRFATRDDYVAKATGPSGAARWWRWKLRHEGPGRPPLPHGTMAGYQRHKREGSDICDECQEAARAYWAAQNERLKASKAARRHEAKLEKAK
jgi:hypothetical protein